MIKRIFIVYWLAMLSALASSVSISDTRCEYRQDPVGVEAPHPRLSWILESKERGIMQTAYQILAATSPASLEKNQGDLWDSGKITSDETTQIVYTGKPLASSQQCFWKVRVWDASGKESGWSKPANWTMGILNPADWQAHWIGFSPPEDADRMNPASFFRKSFAIAKPIRRAIAFASALGAYELHLNGKPVDTDALSPGWTDFHKRVHYLGYDVTTKLHRGQNALGAILGDGWYSGYIAFTGKRHLYGGDPRLIVQLQIEYQDGSREVIGTDGTWKAAIGPILENDMQMGCVYDARAELKDWDPASCDDRNWHAAEVDRNVQANLVVHPGEPIRRAKELPANDVTDPKPGVYVFDIGQNMVGWARLLAKGAAGQKIV